MFASTIPYTQLLLCFGFNNWIFLPHIKYLRSCSTVLLLQVATFQYCHIHGNIHKIEDANDSMCTNKGHICHSVFVWTIHSFSSQLEFLMSNEILSNSTSDGSAHRNFDQLLPSKRQTLPPSIIDKGLNPVLVVYMCLQLLGKCCACMWHHLPNCVWVGSWCLLYASSKHSIKAVIVLRSFWRFLGMVAKHSKHKAFFLLDAWQRKLISRISSEFYLNRLINLLVFFPKPLCWHFLWTLALLSGKEATLHILPSSLSLVWLLEG